MGPVRTISKTVGSVAPSTGPSPADSSAEPRFHRRRNRGGTVEVDAERCPNCSSANLVTPRS